MLHNTANLIIFKEFLTNVSQKEKKNSNKKIANTNLNWFVQGDFENFESE